MPPGQDLAAEVVRRLFPVRVVCALDGTVLDAPQDADARVLPPSPLRAAWLRDLLRQAGIGPDARPGAPPAAVRGVGPVADGMAVVATRDGDPVVELWLRALADVPAVKEAADRVAMFEAILRTGPVMVHVQDADWRSRWSSSELRPELGYHRILPGGSEENLAYIHPDDVAGMRPSRERLLAGEPHVRQRFRVRHASGEWRWVTASSVNLVEDEAVRGVVVHALDITEEVLREQEVAEARRRLAAVIDALDEAVIAIRENTVEFANAQVARMFPALSGLDDVVGRAADELVARVAADMEDPAAYRARIADAVGRGVRGDCLKARAADGRVLEHNLLWVEGEEDREPTRIWVIRDVSTREREDDHRRRLLRLERAARRDAEEREAGLRELDRLKTTFVSDVSHELRTPLSALITYLDLMLEDPDEPLPAGQRRVASSARRTAGRLTRLVSDLLVMGQLESRSLEVRREPFALSAVLEEVVAEAEVGRDATPIELDAPDGPTLVSDRLRVAQIVANLLDNAVKYGPDDRPVRCRARAGGGRWTVEIRDEGPGISAQDAQRAFEPFFRGSSGREAHVPGAGLGLPICARLASLLGGAVELEAVPDGGTVARLVLPLEESDG